MSHDHPVDRIHRASSPGVMPWNVTAVSTLVETRVFTLRQHEASSRLDPAKRGRFVFLDAPDWVNVVALTRDDEVVLIEQYRHGVGEVTLEIPGGMVDDGEEPLPAGLRELREETGYVGGDASLIGCVTPNPAILNNECHTVLVRGVEQLHQPRPEGLEEIVARSVPLRSVPSLIQAGAITHALVIAAFHHLHLHLDETA